MEMSCSYREHHFKQYQGYFFIDNIQYDQIIFMQFTVTII